MHLHNEYPPLYVVRLTPEVTWRDVADAHEVSLDDAVQRATAVARNHKRTAYVLDYERGTVAATVDP